MIILEIIGYLIGLALVFGFLSNVARILLAILVTTPRDIERRKDDS